LWLGIYLFVRGHVQNLVNAPVSLHRTHRDSHPNPLVEVLTRVVEHDDPGGSRRILAHDLHAARWPRRRFSQAPAPVIVAFLLMGMPTGLLRPEPEGHAGSVLLLVGVALALFAVAWSFHRVFSATEALLRFLRFFALEPGFDRLAPFFQTLPPKECGR